VHGFRRRTGSFARMMMGVERISVLHQVATTVLELNRYADGAAAHVEELGLFEARQDLDERKRALGSANIHH
jgi:hypothetical protein